MSKATKQTGAASSTVTDIPHEEISQSNGLTHVAKVITTEEQIKLEVAKFNLADSAIEAMKQNFEGLTIAGAEDKTGYKKVREAWGEVRSTRTKLEKKGLELRNGYTVITKAIKKEEDRLIELITPLEEDLYKKWKEIDEAKELEKQRAIEEEQRLTMARVEAVLAAGMEFKDGFYCIGDAISMDVATLRALPDDQFERLKTAITAKWEEIQLKKHEAEMASIRAAEEMQRQREELERQQREMRQAQEELRLERERVEVEKKEAKMAKISQRFEELLRLGMVYRDFQDCFSYGEDITITDDQIEKYDEAGWKSLVNNAKVDIEIVKEKAEAYRLQQEAEKSALEARKKDIAERAEKAGLKYSYQRNVFEFVSPFFSVQMDFGQLLQFSEKELKGWFGTVEVRIFEANAQMKKQRQDEQAAAEKEAKLGLKDKERFALLVASLEETAGMIDPAEFKTKSFQAMASSLRDRIVKLINEVK